MCSFFLLIILASILIIYTHRDAFEVNAMLMDLNRYLPSGFEMNASKFQCPELHVTSMCFCTTLQYARANENDNYPDMDIRTVETLHTTGRKFAASSEIKILSITISHKN